MDRSSAIGHTWEEVERELFTLEEIAASERKVAAIGKRIEARRKLERRIQQTREYSYFFNTAQENSENNAKNKKK